MLIVTRRLILSSLLFTAFVGSGFLFGSANLPQTAKSGENVVISAENVTKISESDSLAPTASQTVKSAGLRWVFFSFGRKGAR